MDVTLGLIGLGNVGLGALEILIENAQSIQEKLGFGLKVKAVCSRSVHLKNCLLCTEPVIRTTDWREVICRSRDRYYRRGRGRHSDGGSHHRRSPA